MIRRLACVVVCLVCSAAAWGESCPSGNLLASVRPASDAPIVYPERLADGDVVPDGVPWNTVQSAVVAGSAPLLFDLGQPMQVRAMLLQGDHAGPYVILNRLNDGSSRIGDISNTIRLGLIGGGMMPVEALTKTREYVEKRPPVENLMIAQAILSAGLVGAPEEQLGKKAGRRTRSKRSRTGKSGSPRSTEPAQP